MSVYNNNTMANLRTPYYALAGESGSNWYQFSSLTGKVYLTDDTGNHVIQAVGNDLFYDNELLAKAADIQDIADWSLYPALSTILMNGQIITECSSLQVSSITTTNVAATTMEATGVIQGGTLATVPGPYLPGDVKTLTLSATSVSASSNIQGGSLTTTGGIDMTNTGLLRTSNIALSAFGAPPYGNLTSPDGATLTWNGASINTGAAGSASQWANYPAVTNVNANNNNLSNVQTLYGNQAILSGLVQAKTLAAGDAIAGKFLVMTASTITAPVTTLDISSSNDLTMKTTAGGMTNTAYNGITNNVGTNFTVLADRGINPVGSATINMTAQNGNQGVLNLTANPGSVAAFGGQVNITANGGTILLPTDPPTSVTVGGEVNITANTGGAGLYTLTSAVNIGAAGVNSYAGAIPPVASLAGYQFIYGTGGVSVCAGLPASGFQFPGTTYIYGVGIPGVAGGVRIQSPQGIQMLSDTYATNLYPLTSDNLTIQGRSAFPGPEAHVTILDVDTLTMRSGSVITADSITAANTNVTFTSPLATNAITTNGSNLSISGVAGSKYVAISNASTIAFDSASSGAITGLQSINGASWPPPSGDASLWADYPAVSRINVAGLGLSSVSSLTEVSSINGLPYAALDTGLWATYPAVQAVDLSGFGLSNVASMNVLDNFTLTSVSSIGIFSDNAGNINIATNGGGNVNLGTGDLGDINITTGGTGNEVTIAGDVINLGATQGIRMTNGLDMTGNNIINVNNLNGSTGLPLTLNSSSDIAIEATNDAYVEAQTGSANLNGHIDVNVESITGNINLTGALGITLNSPVTCVSSLTVGQPGIPQPLLINGSITASTITGNSIYSIGDVIASSSGSSPISLSTLNGIVRGNQQYNYWVAGNGSDTTGTGSVVKPFATIGGALAATASIPDGTPISICITAGTYTESPTVTRNNTFLVGAVGISNVVVIGTISLIPGPTTQTTISQGMTGISVVGNVICSETTSTEVNWYLDNCNITSYGAAAIAATGNAAGNVAVNFNSCIITQNTTPSAAVQLSACRGNLTLVQVIQNTTSPALSLITGNSSVACNGTTLLCAGSATASAIVFVNNTITPGSTNSFYNTTFQYVASTAGIGKTGVQFSNSVALPQTTFNQCVWYVGGSTTIITRPGTGTISILWGQNVCTPISAVPAAGGGITYTYMTQDFIRANTLRDSANSAGTANQVLTAGATGSGLSWTSLSIQGLGGWVATPTATAYQNSLVMYNSVAGGVSYDTNAYTCVVVTAPSTNALTTTMRGRTYIATSTGAQNLTFTTAGLTANDTGFFVLVKNGNPTNGGDITIVGATGNVLIHNKTITTSGGVGYLYWNGTALIAY